MVIGLRGTKSAKCLIRRAWRKPSLLVDDKTTREDDGKRERERECVCVRYFFW
jgi:hypothetical protein